MCRVCVEPVNIKVVPFQNDKCREIANFTTKALGFTTYVKLL